MLKQLIMFAAVVGLVLALAPAAQAMEMVTIGNPGNAGELSGAGAGGAGPDRICGAVDYTYRIGKYEVTAAEWAAAIFADPNIGDAGSGSGNQPAGSVNWHEAAKFANWMTTGSALSGYYIITAGEASIPGQTHKQYADANGLTYFLPTEDEWYKAAYYDDGFVAYFDYPTGSDVVPMAEGPPGTDLINGSANYANAVGSSTIVGAYTYKPSASPYGTYDQGGNQWEWCEDWIEPGPGPLQRGGGWAATADTLMSNKRWAAGSPWEQPADAGFRVSEVPEPATAVLLLIGVPFVMRRKRR